MSDGFTETKTLTKHFIDKKGKYYCATDIEPVSNKTTTDWDKVTCKNCLRWKRLFK